MHVRLEHSTPPCIFLSAIYVFYVGGTPSNRPFAMHFTIGTAPGSRELFNTVPTTRNEGPSEHLAYRTWRVSGNQLGSCFTTEGGGKIRGREIYFCEGIISWDRNKSTAEARELLVNLIVFIYSTSTPHTDVRTISSTLHTDVSAPAPPRVPHEHPRVVHLQRRVRSTRTLPDSAGTPHRRARNQ